MRTMRVRLTGNDTIIFCCEVHEKYADPAMISLLETSFGNALDYILNYSSSSQWYQSFVNKIGKELFSKGIERCLSFYMITGAVDIENVAEIEINIRRMLDIFLTNRIEEFLKKEEKLKEEWFI